MHNKNNSKQRVQKRRLHTKLVVSALTKFILVCALSGSVVVHALEFRSVAVPKAVLYDAPSASAKKTLLLGQFYPVEIIVNLGDWLKVRDAQGVISWVEAKQLSTKRMLLVKANSAEIRIAADPTSKVVAIIEKDLVLELLDVAVTNGWVKVKHRDGLTGYILTSSIWGVD